MRTYTVKLKEAVNSTDFLGLTEARVIFEKENNGYNFLTIPKTYGEVTIQGNGYFTNDSGDNLGKTMETASAPSTTASSAQLVIIAEDDECSIILDLTKLTTISFRGPLNKASKAYVDAKQLCTNMLSGVDGSNSNINLINLTTDKIPLMAKSDMTFNGIIGCTGDIQHIKKITQIELKDNNPLLYGSIEKMLDFTGYNYILLASSGIYGELKNVIDFCKNQGIKNYKISYNLVGTKCTYNGELITKNLMVSFDLSGNYTVS